MSWGCKIVLFKNFFSTDLKFIQTHAMQQRVIQFAQKKQVKSLLLCTRVPWSRSQHLRVGIRKALSLAFARSINTPVQEMNQLCCWAMIQKPKRRIHGPNSEKTGIRTGFTVLDSSPDKKQRQEATPESEQTE